MDERDDQKVLNYPPRIDNVSTKWSRQPWSSNISLYTALTDV